MKCSTICGGRSYHVVPNRCRKYAITACRIGAAPVTPETSRIGVPSKFPTHTPTVNSGVYPIAQLSRKSVLVPVLHATGKLKRNEEFRPKDCVRAELSLKISAMSHAAPAVSSVG